MKTFRVLVLVLVAAATGHAQTTEHMKNRKELIGKFFSDYEERFNASLRDGNVDVDAAVSAFADCFVESSPVGVMCAKNNGAFKRSLKKGFKHYRSIGTTSMKILSREITDLDAFHSLVKIHWNYAAIRKDGKEITIVFDVFYLLRISDRDARIFAYITGDEAKAMKDAGLSD